MKLHPGITLILSGTESKARLSSHSWFRIRLGPAWRLDRMVWLMLIWYRLWLMELTAKSTISTRRVTSNPRKKKPQLLNQKSKKSMERSFSKLSERLNLKVTSITSCSSTKKFSSPWRQAPKAQTRQWNTISPEISKLRSTPKEWALLNRSRKNQWLPKKPAAYSPLSPCPSVSVPSYFSEQQSNLKT